jgi:septal ring factor EnvC (AmiA/AmiB activator)
MEVLFMADIENNNSKISKLDEQIKKLQAQKTSLLAREKEKERKARTRLLIQQGAILNSMGIDTLEKTNLFKEEFEKNTTFKDWFETFLNKSGK